MATNKHSVWAYEPPADREPVRQLVKLSDGYETVVYRFDPPAGAPEGKLPVIMVHGIQSHPGWYARSSLALADAGHTVYLPTRRGCGENSVARGAAMDMRQLHLDIDKIADHVQAETGCKKMHFVGISWGGKHLSVALANKKRAARAKTLTLLCPGIVAKIKPPLAQRIGRMLFGTIVPCMATLLIIFGCVVAAMARLDPELLVRGLQSTSSYAWLFEVVGIGVVVLMCLRVVVMLKRFPIPLNVPALFTDTQDRREYLATNAETLHAVTGQFGFINARMDRLVRKGRKQSMPTTLVLAERDRIIDNDKTRELVEAMRADAHVVTLPGCHTLEFEEDITPLVDAMLASFERGES